MGLHANEPGFYWKRGKEDCGSGDKVMGAGHYEGSPGTLAGTECCCGVVLLAAPPHDSSLSITGCCYRKKKGSAWFVSAGHTQVFPGKEG